MVVNGTKVVATFIHESNKAGPRLNSDIPAGFFTATAFCGFPNKEKIVVDAERYLFLKTDQGVTCLSEDTTGRYQSMRNWPKSQERFGEYTWDRIPVYGYKPVQALDIRVTV